MHLGLANKLMCAKSFRRNQSKPMTDSEIPVRRFADVMQLQCRLLQRSSFKKLYKVTFLLEDSSLKLNGRSFDRCFLEQGLACLWQLSSAPLFIGKTLFNVRYLCWEIISVCEAKSLLSFDCLTL